MRATLRASAWLGFTPSRATLSMAGTPSRAFTSWTRTSSSVRPTAGSAEALAAVAAEARAGRHGGVALRTDGGAGGHRLPAVPAELRPRGHRRLALRAGGGGGDGRAAVATEAR